MIINSISFKANYINSKKIKHTSDNTSYCDASFVKLNPRSFVDKTALEIINTYWDAGKTFADSVAMDLEMSIFNPNGRDFFALTTQKDNLDILIPEEILGIAETRQENRNTIKLKYLQVDPANTNSSTNPTFKGIGTAILNSIKEYFPRMDITLFSTDSALSFYKNNGFKSIKANQLIFKR